MACANFAAFSASLLLLWPLVSGAEETQLAWKFTPGAKLSVTRQQLAVSHTSVANKPVKTSIETNLEMTWTVDAVDAAGVAKITQSLDRITTTMDAGSGLVLFDSAITAKPTGAAKTLADGVAPLVGGTFLVTMTPRGEITDLQPSTQLAKVFSAGKEEAVAASSFSVQGVAKLLQQPLLLLPERGVEPEATWETERTLPSSLGTLTQTLTYQYVGLGEGELAKVARINISGAIAPPKAAAGAPKLVANELTGFALFNTATGSVSELSLKQSLELTSIFANMPLAVKTESKVTTKIVKAEAATP